MQFDIRSSGNTTSNVSNRWKDLFARSLKRHEHLIRLVCVYLEDVNGPRGGVDKQCRCVLHARRLPPIVIQDRDASMNALMHRVASRATYVLTQKAGRRRTKAIDHRRPGKRLASVEDES